VSPRPRNIHLGPLRIFSKIRGDIRESMFIAGAVDTGDKLFTGVNDTVDIFIAGVKHSFANNSANFRKIETVLMEYSGATGTHIHEKTPS